MKFHMAHGRLILEFHDYNGLIKDVEEIDKFIKGLKKEVIKFKKWVSYKTELEKSNQLTIETEQQ